MTYKEFQETVLEEIILFSNGKKRPKENGEIPVYGGNGILDYCNQYNSEGESLIIGRVGAYCGNVYLEKRSCWISDNAILGKVKKGYSTDFMYYKLVDMKLQNLQIGSTQPLLTQSLLKKIKTSVPSLNEQKAIANVLSSLDEKIEINNAINKKLEEMAQAIFKQWFVDFEFPDEEGKPYKSSGGAMVESELGMIPEGWSVKKIGEVTKIIRGASPRPIQNFIQSSGCPWVKISDATASNSKFIYKTREFIKNEGIKKSREVFPGTLVLSNSATPGLPKIMLIRACVHDGWLIFDEYSGITKEFLYLYLLKERESILSLSNGSVFRNLKTDILKNYKIIIPEKPILEKAQSMFLSFDKEIERRTQESQKLISIRDNLLPKLMSGEIRVPLDKG